MDDKNNAQIPGPDNIRALTYFFGLMIDHQLAEMRRDTPYAQVRASDIRVFVTAARGPKSISAIARALHISRQAAQNSVQRLVELGVIEVATMPENKRDKLVTITPRGKMAGVTAAKQIAEIEQAFSDVIGVAAWADLRNNLKKLVDTFAKDLPKSALMA